MKGRSEMLEQARTAPWAQQAERYRSKDERWFLQVDDLLDYEGTATGYDGGGSFSAVVRFGTRTKDAQPGWLYDVEHDVCAGDEREEDEPLATLEEAQAAAREQLIDFIEDWCESTYVNVVSSYGERDGREED